MMMITPEQLRAARALASMDQKQVADAARVSVVTVKRAESSDGFKKVGDATVGQIKTVLEKAGIEFIPDGVRKAPVAKTTDADALIAILMEKSAKIAEQLRGHPILTDDEMYDENGLPK